MSTTRAKAETSPAAVGFGPLVELPFCQQLALVPNRTKTFVSASKFLPTACKIYRIIAGFDGTAVSGTCNLRFVMGIGADTQTQYARLPYPDTDYANQPVPPNPQAYPPAYPLLGMALTFGAVNMTMTPNTSTLYTPNDSAVSGSTSAGNIFCYAPGTPGFAYDSIWGPAGALITLRTTTNGTASGNLYVSLLVKFYDPTYGKLSNVGTSFNPAVDIP